MLACWKRRRARISEHFTRAEFTCRCGCGQCYIDHDLVWQAEWLRNAIGLPVIVHSVNRCVIHNANEGGTPTSEHLLGHAMDLHVKKMLIIKLHEFVRFNHEPEGVLSGGLGLYDWGVHIDTGVYRLWKGV